jgi:hypothetical protein
MLAAQRGVPGIVVQTSPAVWPTLPLLPALGILVGLLPAWLSPLPPLRALARAEEPAGTPARHGGTGYAHPETYQHPETYHHPEAYHHRDNVRRDGTTTEHIHPRSIGSES